METLLFYLECSGKASQKRWSEVSEKLALWRPGGKVFQIEERGTDEFLIHLKHGNSGYLRQRERLIKNKSGEAKKEIIYIVALLKLWILFKMRLYTFWKFWAGWWYDLIYIFEQLLWLLCGNWRCVWVRWVEIRKKLQR